MKRAAISIPVLLKFGPESARQDAWGRLERLTSGGAELSTPVRVIKEENVFLSFELGGREFADIRARVLHAADDADGHRLAELGFRDEVQRRELAKALVDVLAR